jgi:hypothetical protein
MLQLNLKGKKSQKPPGDMVTGKPVTNPAAVASDTSIVVALANYKGGGGNVVETHQSRPWPKFGRSSEGAGGQAALFSGSGLPDQEIGWPFLFKGIVIGTIS